MKKRVVFILSCILTFLVVGCSKTSENFIGESINNKYLYYSTSVDGWINKKYGYGINETIIFSFNDDNTTAYILNKDVEEQLQFSDLKLDKDGYGITYNFKSQDNKTYTLYALMDKENKDRIQYKWTSPQDDMTHVLSGQLLTKEECEDKIVRDVIEVELENMLLTNFHEDANLDIDNIKLSIDKARDTIYEQTKDSRDKAYYRYSPGGSYGGVNNDNNMQYYPFVGIELDENGEIFAMHDSVILVNVDDFTLYTYTPTENGKAIMEKYKPESSEVASNNNDSSDNSITSNQSESTSTPTSKYSREEIQAKYDKDVSEGGLLHATVHSDTKVINGELCYYITYGWENASGPVDRIGYIGSNTLTVYQDAEYFE